MANIRVSYGEMEQAASALGQGREEIAARLRALQGQIQGLVASGFVTDQASVRFEAAYAEYTAGASTVVERLGDIQAFLAQAASVLRDTDAQIAARIR